MLIRPLSLRLTLCTVIALFAGSARAQRVIAAGPPLDTSPPAEAHQFDFLLGDWKVVALPKVSALVAMIHGQPKLAGSWKAWRSVDGFGVEDEMRLASDEGDPLAFTHTLRVYDRKAHHWTGASLDVYRTTLQTTTAVWQNGKMLTDGVGTNEEGKAYISRGWYYDVTPQSFRYQQQRSYDHGATWEDVRITIEAQRATHAHR